MCRMPLDIIQWGRPGGLPPTEPAGFMKNVILCCYFISFVFGKKLSHANHRQAGLIQVENFCCYFISSVFGKKLSHANQ